jgi:glutamate dehydrogenase/leucine dehydrogenase
MKKGVDLQEVILLAKTMEIKFSVSDPDIGGAKSGIDFDPSDERKVGVLNRIDASLLSSTMRCYWIPHAIT